jgi:hypothetical protein
MEAVGTVVRPMRELAKDSVRLVNKCHKSLIVKVSFLPAAVLALSLLPFNASFLSSLPQLVDSTFAGHVTICLQ